MMAYATIKGFEVMRMFRKDQFKLYDRTSDAISLDEVKRVVF